MNLGLGLGLGPAVAAAASPPELWPQPVFAASTGLTLGSWIFATGSVTSGEDTTFCSATALATLTAGTYRIAGTIADNPNEDSLRVQIGGTLALSRSALGPFTSDVPVASVSTQVIRFNDLDGLGGIQLTAFSVKQIA